MVCVFGGGGWREGGLMGGGFILFDDYPNKMIGDIRLISVKLYWATVNLG